MIAPPTPPRAAAPGIDGLRRVEVDPHDGLVVHRDQERLVALPERADPLRLLRHRGELPEELAREHERVPGASPEARLHHGRPRGAELRDEPVDDRRPRRLVDVLHDDRLRRLAPRGGERPRARRERGGASLRPLGVEDAVARALAQLTAHLLGAGAGHDHDLVDHGAIELVELPLDERAIAPPKQRLRLPHAPGGAGCEQERRDRHLAPAPSRRRARGRAAPARASPASRSGAPRARRAGRWRSPRPRP